MRLGAFVFGGLVGAAAVIYLSNRTKPMAWSALSSDMAGSLFNMGNKSANSNKFASETQHSFQSSGLSNSSTAKSARKETVFDESLFKADGLNTVQEIVNQDPKLKAAVDEIMAGTNTKSEQHAH